MPDPREHSTEEQLRRQVDDLKRQLRERSQADVPEKRWNPSAITIAALVLGLGVVIAGAFIAGYIPLKKREALIRDEERAYEQSLPRMEVIQVGRGGRQSELELPGNLQAVTEAPILARTDGYIKSRLVDIGDHVKAGQPLAEIDAPEVDQSIRQAKAAVEQAKASLEQAQASLLQGKSNMELARITAGRWKNLASQGIVSSQENDQYQAQLTSQTANVQALEKAVSAQNSNVAAAEANVARLEDVQGYRVVKAPFDGVVTQRNIDVGALASTGTTLLFRIAQIGMLRAYVNVPQTNANSVHVGQPASLTVSNLAGRTFRGTVARTANALDPTTRTMLVEVSVSNADGTLFPGMFAQVDLSSARADPPLIIPAEALIVRTNGAQVGVVDDTQTVHLQKIEVGRDYGDRLEVARGLRAGQTILAAPGETAREGTKITPVQRTASAP